MNNEYKLKFFDDLVKIGTTMGKNWFRGHSKMHNDLRPGIYRSKYHQDIHRMFKPEHEFDLIANFKRYAPSVYDASEVLPDEDQNLKWLLLMQHYGLPTRLLDWTENILFAAFFAVTSNPTEDGELWSLYPDHLNKQSGIDGLPLIKSSIINFISNEALHSDPNTLAHEYGLGEVPSKPIAFLPPVLYKRMSHQQSVFTIHPKASEDEGIEKLIPEDKYLTRYIIPKEVKVDFERKLSYLGVTYRTLFPDFEGLSKSFLREEKYYGWGQPDPPIIED
jgi:hypothetical protein